MKKPVALVIMDGLGSKVASEGNAVTLAKHPFLDKIWAEYPTTEIRASEKWVGLPEGQMGNSEVGHLNIGAGRIVYQSLVRINLAIEENTLKDNKTINEAIAHANNNNGKVHVLGLVSDGGVHSHSDHIIALDKIIKSLGGKSYVHAYTDGRDVDPVSASKFVGELVGNGAEVVSISGRYYSMDRDKKFERTILSYNASVYNQGPSYTNVMDYIKSEAEAGRNDEFILPAYDSTKNIKIEPGDAIIFANFRPDRARQMTHLFLGSTTYDYTDVKPMDNIYFASMMEYAGMPTKLIFEPIPMSNLLGDVIAAAGKTQIRAAETEKYPHVTFFMDGGVEKELPGATRILVNSPAVATYDLQPEMSAPELTQKILEVIEDTDVAIINYANPDMVGHSGSIPATIKAVETTNDEVEKLYNKIVTEMGGVMIITADHGNAETMLDENHNPWTAHTTAPVKICITSHDVQIKDKFMESNEVGKLGDIAPTILQLAGIEQPAEMTGESLIK